MDKWLEALQKVNATTPASAKPEPNVDGQFKDLVKVSDDDDVAVPVTHQLYLNDAGVAEIPDPVSALFAKAQRDRFGIPEFAPSHDDGIFLEKSGDQLWTYTYQGGALVKQELEDPKVGHLCFDGTGNEVAKRDLVTSGRHNASAHFSSLREHLDLIDAGWAELLGGAYPERKPEVSGDSKTKVASSEAYNVGGQVLAKGAIESRMLKILAEIRSFCIGDEEELIAKAIKCLDFITFGELAEPVLARMKQASIRN